MDDYAAMGHPAMKVDLAHARYARNQYPDSAYAPAPASMHMPGYEWSSGYPAQPHDVMAHSRGTGHAAPPRSTAQSLRSKIAERLLQIDRDALLTRERRYQQKGDEIQGEITMILRGTHPVFADGVARLKAEHERTLVQAEEHHQYMLALYEQTYQQEREQAEEAYQAEKKAIHSKIAADIEERRRRLKEEKDSLDITSDFVLETGVRASSKRNLRKRGLDTLTLGDTAASSSTSHIIRAMNKRKGNQGSQMTTLPEEDIVSDLVALRRVTGVTGPLTGAANGKKGHKHHRR
ncbi:hypothetical protein H4R18_003318 [Coemansia javaensis]|uniref:Uncharacterized protein n=1 Tax=Coemansia javaensis TaxID=2761396 RepID=A0A9W8HCG1_9FUNG|nr:hypothetical protein H4R18_003318 [Coemansia javaensis]